MSVATLPQAPITFLSVNPAFLQEIKDSNPDYWESINQVRQVCRSQEDSIILCRGLCKRLDRLRDALALQFSLEESYGYMTIPGPDSDHSSDHRLGEMTARTHAQHSTLYLKLSDLAERAEELQYRGVELNSLHQLVSRVQLFASELQDHEHVEAQLIERTLGQVKSGATQHL